ncbi:MAG: Lrp/AsnC family transcriptional regulator [Candidatus Thorarchaeota archaeon]
MEAEQAPWTSLRPIVYLLPDAESVRLSEMVHMGSNERIDRYDEKIIEELFLDSRRSLRDIGKKVKLSASSVRNRMARLKELGVIRRYTVDVDWRKMGYDIQVLLLITSWTGASREIYETLTGYEQVMQVFWTSGPTNLVCIVRVRNMQELSQFITKRLEGIRGVEKIDTMFLMPVPEE